MYPRPTKLFDQLAPDEQKFVRAVLEEQPMIKNATPELRVTLIEQLIGYINQGHARILCEDDKFILQIHPQVLAAIKTELGIE